MGVVYELAPAADCAPAASRILEEAWKPPALCYPPEYLRWQLSFPGPFSPPAAIASEGNQAIGFAAATERRVLCGAGRLDVVIVSFVAVRPGWQNRGVAAGLYRCLLGALKQAGARVVTYAAAGSSAERALLRAYADAGFQILPLGSYPVYSFLARGEAASSEWQASIGAPAPIMPSGEGDSILWSDPSPEQLAHYTEDPRPRRFIALTSGNGKTAAAAWAVRAGFRVPNRGVDTVTTVESVCLSRQCAAGLPALLRCAASAWEGASPIVNAPSLYGFDTAELRRLGIRQTGAPFNGYFCSAGELPAGIRGTSLEVI